MCNVQNPDVDNAPWSARLLKTAVIAATVVVAILVTAVLCAEYGIDLTGTGGVLAEEVVMDRETSQEVEGRRVVGSLLGLFVSTVYPQKNANSWDEKVYFTLIPGESTKYKLVMNEGAEIEFLWTVKGGVVNYNLHGDGDGQNIRYKTGRRTPEGKGTLKAEFSGNHGWLWRNSDSQEVSITLSVRGDYQDLKRAD